MTLTILKRLSGHPTRGNSAPIECGLAITVTSRISNLLPKDQLQPKVSVQFYPKPGDPVDIDRIDDTLFHNPYRMSRLTWRKDSATLSFEYDQRGHQVYRLIEADAETGKPRVAAGDEAKTFTNTGSNRLFRHDVDGLGDEVIWASERDGWNHLYLYDGHARKGPQPNRQGRLGRARRRKGGRQKAADLVFRHRLRPGEDPYLQHYYRIDFDGRNLTPITTANAYHDVSFSSDMAFYVDTYSRTDLPNIMELHRTSDGSLVSEVEHGEISKLTAAGFKPPEVLVAKGRDGKTDIWGLIVKPRNFDPSKEYPVAENIYAGPHGSLHGDAESLQGLP
jgi:hypothetical protein